MYLHIPENYDFFVFGNRLGLVFIPPLWDFNTVMLAHLPVDICSCLIVPLQIVSFCKFGTARCDVIYCFFMLVAYPAQWTGAVLHNPCNIRLGREALVLGCKLSVPPSQLSVPYF